METGPSISENCDTEVPNECNSELEDTVSDDESTSEQEYWSSDVETSDIDYDDEEREDSASLNRIVFVTIVFIFLWASFYGVSAVAVNHLLQYLHHMLSTLAVHSPAVASVVAAFPSSLYLMKKMFAIGTDKFEKYVICGKCESLYQYSECFQYTLFGKSPKTCSHVSFPNHPHASRRTQCGHKLVKEIVTKKGTKYSPVKTYCYLPLVESMTTILKRENMLDQCELWRKRETTGGTFSDIYDGRVWKEFQIYKGQPFLSEPHNLAVMLNCDWFQPFAQSRYTVGVIYLVILNLPRAIRFRPENIIVTGIIPGPKEPKNMNSYLRPLVKELNSLWSDGFSISINSQTVKVRVALLATVCDIPATQKIGGFCGHSSKQACWKCKKVFPYAEELNRVDFSGVEIGDLRQHDEHKRNGKSTLSAVTPTKRKELELEIGSRFTQLFFLPYYNSVRFAIIDPMHNLFLGTSKRVLEKVWLENGLLSRTDLEAIQTRVDQFVVPRGVGRIPRKITSKFDSLTADEWKNWTLLFSIICLYDFLPEADLDCWHLFVSACKIFCSSVITVDDIDEAHSLMKRFFIAAESLYGPKFLSLNAHLHLHLEKCYKDYGPCYGFWLFSFERYNGILGKYHTNDFSIELQLMRRFSENMTVNSLLTREMLDSEHEYVFTKFLSSKISGTSSETLFGQVHSTSVNHEHVSSHILLQSTNVVPSLEYVCNCQMKLLSPYRIQKFDDSHLNYLRTAYKTFLPEFNILETPQLYRKHTLAQWWSQQIGFVRHSGDNDKRVVIYAHWIGSDGQITCNCDNLCAGEIQYYFSQRVKVGNDLQEVYMAHVNWYQGHPEKNKLPEPIQVWCSSLYKPFGPASFLLLMRIHQVCASVEVELNCEKVLFVNPIRNRLFL